MRQTRLILGAICMLGLQVAPATAAVTLYTSQSAFNAAITGASTYGFEGIAPAGGIAVTTPTIAGVTFSSNGIPFVIDAAATPSYGVSFFSGQGNTPNDPANALTITTAGYKAFGLLYGSYISSGESYSATLSTGDVFSFATDPTPGTALFLGFISDEEITSIDLVSTAGVNVDGSTGYGYAFDIPSFTLGNAVPEPGTWVSMLAGFALLGSAMRRGGRRAAVA
jgi:hypothetical protein